MIYEQRCAEIREEIQGSAKDDERGGIGPAKGSVKGAMAQVARKKSWNNAGIVNTCQRCGNLFSVSPRSAKQRFCSRGCFRNKVKMECQFCGASFEVNQWRAKNGKGKFCSFRCRCSSSENRISVQCENCGIPFFKKESQFSRTSSGLHFCCHPCSFSFHRDSKHPMFAGGLSYGFEWKEIRVRIRARDKVCQVCGKTPKQNNRNLDVHHKIPFQIFGYKYRRFAHADINLVALCRSCHKSIEPWTTDRI